MKKSIVLGSCLLAVSSMAIAEDGFKGSAELGLVLTTGNTETQTLNTKGALAYTKGMWTHAAGLEALNVQGKDGRLSEKYTGAAKTVYRFSDKAYAFGTANGEHDPFSGYSYQVSGALGAGYRALQKSNMTLDLEAGPGYRELKLRSGDTDGEAVLRAGGKFAWTLSKTSEFTQEVNTEIGSDATITKSITAITAQVVGSLAMKASLTVKNNSDVPDNVEDTDTETALTLVYSF